MLLPELLTSYRFQAISYTVHGVVPQFPARSAKSVSFRLWGYHTVNGGA